MDQVPETSPEQQMPSTPQGPGFLQKYKFTLLALAVVLIAAVPLLLLSNTASKSSVQPTTQNTSQGATMGPTTAPLTTDNADATFSQSDTQIQSTLNQMNTDMQQESQVDFSQDSTTGL